MMSKVFFRAALVGSGILASTAYSGTASALEFTLDVTFEVESVTSSGVFNNNPALVSGDTFTMSATFDDSLIYFDGNIDPAVFTATAQLNNNPGHFFRNELNDLSLGVVGSNQRLASLLSVNIFNVDTQNIHLTSLLDSGTNVRTDEIRFIVSFGPDDVPSEIISNASPETIINGELELSLINENNGDVTSFQDILTRETTLRNRIGGDIKPETFDSVTGTFSVLAQEDFFEVTQFLGNQEANLRVVDVSISPVPEPSSLALTALAGLALVRRRRTI